MKEVHLEYGARVASIEYEYYAGKLSGLVQLTEIVLVMEMQPLNLAGLHILHCSSPIPALHPRPMTMVLPSIFSDLYRAQ